MKTAIFSTLLFASTVLTACGDYSLMQGSGTTGILPLKTKEKTDAPSQQKVEIDLQETMDRWNVVADGITIPSGVVGSDFDFLWTEEDHFPHPTFKGGSAEAYEVFSNIYIDFFNDEDNFEYLKRNNLLDRELNAGLGVKTSFRDIAEVFSEHFLLSRETRAKIKHILDAMTPNYTLTEI